MPRGIKKVASKAVKQSKQPKVVANRKLATTLGRIAKFSSRLEKLIQLAVQQAK